MSDRFSTLLLPVDEHDNIDPSASSFSLCLNMYHTPFGQVILTVLTTSTTIFPGSNMPQNKSIDPNSLQPSQWMGSPLEHFLQVSTSHRGVHFLSSRASSAKDDFSQKKSTLQLYDSRRSTDSISSDTGRT
eukprot:scaffold124078_cov31-Attheya_sp.AAC.1